MGSRKTRIPSIVEPTDSNLLTVIRQMKEVMEVAEMRRGDKLDAKVSFRDLINGGLAVAGGGLGGLAGTGGTDPTDRTTPGPGSEFLKPPSYDGLVLPGRPANVHTRAVWDGIQIIWDWPDTTKSNTYWKRAVLWSSATPDWEDADLLGYTTTNMYTHAPIGLSSGSEEPVAAGTRYYWVAWEGLYNEVTGEPDRSDTNPYQWENGVMGQTAIDPEYALGILGGQVSEYILDLDLGARIDLVDYDPENPSERLTTSVQERILSAAGDFEGVYAAIAEVARTSVSEDGTAKGEYSIRVDANGAVAGIGLSAYSRMDGVDGDPGTRDTGTAFVMNVDHFVMQGWIPRDPQDWYNPDNNKYKEIQPFIISRVGNEATVGINGELIVNGTITATSIQAGTIGAREINAQEIYADFLTANNIITGNLSTSNYPNMRVEINGEGTSKEKYPFWFGRGTTGDVNTTVFSCDNDGNVGLAGNLYVTGHGKFFCGNYGGGEWRLELGGPADDFLLWAGTGTKSKSNDNYAFWIDRFGNANFKGDLEARYVSGEISRQLPINEQTPVTGTLSAALHVGAVAENEWKTVGEWTLPQSQFQPHLPTMTVSMSTYGKGVRAAAYRVHGKTGGGSYKFLYSGFISMWEYGTNTTVQANAPGKTDQTYTFRLQFCGADSARVGSGSPGDQGGLHIPTCGNRVGYLLGLR